MKRIKKLTASLLALAITCAGINCIPASAIYQFKYIYLTRGRTATASVDYTPRRYYVAKTSGNGNYYKNVNAYAEGMWGSHSLTAWGDDHPAKVTFEPMGEDSLGQVYSIGFINYFYSRHTTMDVYDDRLKSEFFTIYS